MMFSKLNCLIFIFFIINYVSKEGVAGNQSAVKNDPCEPYDPSLPDLSRANRRLSTTKCFEYLWRIKTKFDKADRVVACERSKCEKNNTCVLYGGGIGGRNALDGEFPHMAAIGWKATNTDVGYYFKCCGSLISEKFVLTAGHCVRSVQDTRIADPVPKIVRLGNINISNKRFHTDIDIVNIIPHYNYRPPKKYYDIALMKLAKPIEFSYYIQPACLLVDADVQRFGPSVTATGWGVTQLGGETSEDLQAVSLELFDSNYCDSLLEKSCNRNWCGFQDHQICAANLSGGVDTCYGDSGGPLQVEIPLPKKYSYRAKMKGIIGVTSFGVKCALRNSPGIYTRVPYFLDWIEDIVWRYEDHFK